MFLNFKGLFSIFLNDIPDFFPKSLDHALMTEFKVNDPWSLPFLIMLVGHKAYFAVVWIRVIVKP